MMGWWSNLMVFFWIVQCCLCSLVRPAYDHLRSPCSHSDSDIIRAAITQRYGQGYCIGKPVCFIWQLRSSSIGHSGFSWFPSVAADECRWCTWKSTHTVSSAQISANSFMANFTSHSTLCASLFEFLLIYVTHSVELRGSVRSFRWFAEFSNNFTEFLSLWLSEVGSCFKLNYQCTELPCC
jgi:hypothetical protein